ncbi:unnamed protein product [Staurois parvus]|uniref:Uncharacterized protein n=1 Tax=Staurois parvus TaxID=386267 RepID=A0ABN9DJG2_9NEOB|nr:unnamed protein product [Staurois parvus]
MDGGLSGGQWRDWQRWMEEAVRDGEGWRTLSGGSGRDWQRGWRTLSGGQWRDWQRGMEDTEWRPVEGLAEKDGGH